MVVQSLQDYMTDTLVDRVQVLQTALNQAESIMMMLEQENTRLKDVLSSLTSENNEDYAANCEAFDEPLYSFKQG